MEARAIVDVLDGRMMAQAYIAQRAVSAEETQRLRIPEGGPVAPARLNGAITLKSILDRAPG
jgi:hypothetical protein